MYRFKALCWRGFVFQVSYSSSKSFLLLLLLKIILKLLDFCPFLIFFNSNLILFLTSFAFCYFVFFLSFFLVPFLFVFFCKINVILKCSWRRKTSYPKSYMYNVHLRLIYPYGGLCHWFMINHPYQMTMWFWYTL